MPNTIARSAYSQLDEQNLRFYLWFFAGIAVSYTCCATMAVGGLQIKHLDDRIYVSVIFIPVRMCLLLSLVLALSIPAFLLFHFPLNLPPITFLLLSIIFYFFLTYAIKVNIFLQTLWLWSWHGKDARRKFSKTVRCVGSCVGVNVWAVGCASVFYCESRVMWTVGWWFVGIPVSGA